MVLALGARFLYPAVAPTVFLLWGFSALVWRLSIHPVRIPGHTLNIRETRLEFAGM